MKDQKNQNPVEFKVYVEEIGVSRFSVPSERVDFKVFIKNLKNKP